jgi:hypothetical protein
MAYDDSPKAFFGPGYSLASNEIKLKTSDAADVSVGTFTADGTTAVLTVSTAHSLKVGDKVSLTTTTTLPTGLASATDYFVSAVGSTTTLELSTTFGGASIIPSSTGSGTHTIHALSQLAQVTDAEANASSGDFRAVAFGLIEMLYQRCLNTPSADRSTKFTITRSSSTDETTGELTRYYTVTAKLQPLAVEVSAE